MPADGTLAAITPAGISAALPRQSSSKKIARLRSKSKQRPSGSDAGLFSMAMGLLFILIG